MNPDRMIRIQEPGENAPMSQKQYPIVVVTWRDHMSEDEWRSLEGIGAHMEADPITSIGFLVHEDAKKLVLAMNIADDDTNNASLFMTILKGTVETVQQLDETLVIYGK